MNVAGKWPKAIPPLTKEQERISDDFMKHWHEVLPRRYGLIEKFNHTFSVRSAPSQFQTTLEIGAGLGEHLRYEKLTSEQTSNYYALEMRPNMAQVIRYQFPAVKVIVGDCQKRIEMPTGFFDRVLAIHVLEHLPNLPATVWELHRLTNPQRGQLSVVIPCEGGLAYSLARKISAQRIFEKRYGQSYSWFISREHINRPAEILEELTCCFQVVHRQFFPLMLPWVNGNLCIGLTLKPLGNVSCNEPS